MSPKINPSIPVVGQSNASEEPKIVSALSQLVSTINSLDSDNITDGTLQDDDLAASLQGLLGLTGGGTTRRVLKTYKTDGTELSSTTTTRIALGLDAQVTVSANSFALAFYSLDMHVNSDVYNAYADILFNGTGYDRIALAHGTGYETFRGTWATVLGSGTHTFDIDYAVDSGGTLYLNNVYLGVVTFGF